LLLLDDHFRPDEDGHEEGERDVENSEVIIFFVISGYEKYGRDLIIKFVVVLVTVN